MIYSIFRVFLCCSVGLLVGCLSHTQQLAPCKLSCLQQFNQCSQVCSNDCGHCSAKADCSAAKSYHKYVQEQSVRGGIIARELKSYRDPLQCRKTTCDCRADYDVCVRFCAE